MNSVQMDYQQERITLVDTLDEISKQCEIRFGGRTELATEFDKRVTQLCFIFEQVLLHGLKQNRSVRDFTRKVVSRSLPKSFLNGNALTPDRNSVTFWHFVKCFLSRHELERYQVLKHVHTEVGRGRAWLRSSLNEHSLERNLTNMIEDARKLRAQFYEDHALLRDDTLNRKLLDIARNLSEILFAINIDNGELDQEVKQKPKPKSIKASDPLPVIVNRTASDIDYGLSSSFDANRKKTFKTLKGNLIRFEDNDDTNDVKLSTSLQNECYLDTHSAPNTPTMRNRLSMENSCKSSPETKKAFKHTNPIVCKNNTKLLTRCATDPTTSLLRQYQEEDKSDEELQMMQDCIPTNVLLTPITADNYSLIDSFAPASEEDAEKLSCNSQNATITKDQDSLAQDSLVMQKLQEQAQSELDDRLKKEIEVITRKVQFKIARLEAQNDLLVKENESLKMQLKKYIDAVQLLKPNEQHLVDQHTGDLNQTQRRYSLQELNADQTHSSLSLSQPAANPENDDSPTLLKIIQSDTWREQSPDFSEYEQTDGVDRKAYFQYRDAIEYERKLIQVAEMHGELVEFNDRLHRLLMQKDATIKRLKDELIELRGPLPEGIQSSDDDEMTSIVSDIEPQTLQSQMCSLSASVTPAKPLINIWIPSAFLVGQQQNQLNTTDSLSNTSSTSSSHHVYQVYIRIKDEEWNVYRRYSQFYTLHKYLKKKFPQVALLEFPPKKAIGNKHARVVQERRKKLETYLRNALNIIQTEEDVVDKASLVRHLPFLSDKRAKLESDNDRTSEGSEHHNRDNEDQHYFGL